MLLWGCWHHCCLNTHTPHFLLIWIHTWRSPRGSLNHITHPDWRWTKGVRMRPEEEWIGWGWWETEAFEKVQFWQKWRKHCGLYSLSAGTSTLKSLLGSGFVDTKSTAQMWGVGNSLPVTLPVLSQEHNSTGWSSCSISVSYLVCNLLDWRHNVLSILSVIKIKHIKHTHIHTHTQSQAKNSLRGTYCD